MPTPPHIPVLERAVIETLAVRATGIYVDATVGAGGHSAAILAAAPGVRVIACDRDPRALTLARSHLSGTGDSVAFVHGRFGDLAAHLAALGVGPVDGILLDLGVSSMQLDDATRGFSFSRAGPIDMRMDSEDDSTPTALELIRATSSDELASILRNFGEERYSHRIAARLREAAREGRLETTTDLAALVTAVIPEKNRRQQRIHPATRTFQALRIAVNRELAELEQFLEVFPELLAPGGRCAVISFHSLEDRMVKHRFRELAESSSLPRHLALATGERPDPICLPITKKPITPSDDEVAINPRARSAKLRACAKVGTP
jgi:16S rRNA (cytosine1402-N4)-methyltransferase